MTDESAAEAPNETPRRPMSLLAKDLFGSEFKGEAEQPEPTEPAAAETQPTEGGEAEPSEEATSADEAETSGDDTAEANDQGATEEAADGEAETGEVPVSSFQDLVEQNEWDWEWFKSLKVPVNVDGTTTEATFSDLVKSYRGAEAADKRLEEAKAIAKAAEEDRQAKIAAIDEEFTVAAQLLADAQEILDADTKSADLQKLREDDPAEYAARSTELAERQKKLDERKRETRDAYQREIQRRQEQLEKEREARLPAERKALLEKLPEWREPEQASAGQTKAVNFLRSQGFTDDEITAVAYDHRLLMTAYKAAMFDEQKATTSAVKKKLAKVPKVLKPGSPKPEEQRNQERVQKAAAAHRKAGTVDSAYALLKAKRGG